MSETAPKGTSSTSTSSTSTSSTSTSSTSANSDSAASAGAGIQDRLRSDLTAAMRARDDVATAALRMALTAIRAEEVAGASARELSGEEMITVLGREVKKRREAADAFAAAGRPEQAEREQRELAVLQAYLPAQLSDEDLASVVAEAVAAALATGTSGMAAMGRVMKAVQPRVAGRAEGARVAAEVRRQLSA